MDFENQHIENSFLKTLDWIPTKYEHLLIITNPNDYQGQSIINIDIINTTNSLSFDAIELKVSEVQIEQKKWKGTIKFFEDTKSLKLKILLSENLQKGKATITIKFKGLIREDGIGVFKLKPNNSIKEKATTAPFNELLVTHFEPNFASLCFPCLTNSAVRSIFSLSIIIPNQLQVISNTNISHTSPDKNNSTLYQFEDTPSIPSYLFAFTVGNFFQDEQEFLSRSESKIPVKSFVPKGFYSDAKAKEIGKTLLNAAISSISALESYFDVPLFLSKIDFCAIPNMMFVGMENIGCCFLHVAPNQEENTLETDILHEVTHQWVGNLVGMSVKMKEGIVQYIEKLYFDKLFTKIKTAKKKSHSQVKKFSSGKTTSPTVANILKEFHASFNEDFYKKAQQNIEEIVEKIGEKQFQSNLSSLLKSFSFQFVDEEIIQDWLSKNK